jgi:hypothetical protein
MNDILVPSWIRERRDENALRDAKTEAESSKRVADSLRIQRDSPEYLETLAKELARNTDALHKINFSGNTSGLPTFSPNESVYRVSVSIPGNFPKQTYTDVFFRDNQVECSMLNGGIRRYYFSVDHEGRVGLAAEIPDGTPRLLSAAAVAEGIVRRMVDYLEHDYR